MRDDISALTYPFQIKRKLDFVKEYESEMCNFIGVNYCVSFAYARTAFWAILKSLELPKGSRIILPSITIKAMLDVVIHLELSPVFVDTDVRTGSVDIESLKELLKDKPKLILLTYLFGVVPNINEIMALLRSEPIFIVEDFSQCLNGEFEGDKVGTFGDASILSTSAVKTLDTYGGGLLFTNDFATYQSVKLIQSNFRNLSLFAYFKRVLLSLVKNILTGRLFFPFLFVIVWIAIRMDSSHFVRFVGARSKAPIRSLPEEWFAKLSPWQARCGLKYLKRVKKNDQIRIDFAKKYATVMKFVGHDSHPKAHSVFWQCVITDFEPKSMRLKLARLGIDSAQTSLVLLSELPEYGWDLSTKNTGAKFLYERGVYIPMYHQLRKREIARIISAFSTN
jgi:dTDP-4-amino-4,6-dideoxygalactose transaminase